MEDFLVAKSNLANQIETGAAHAAGSELLDLLPGIELFPGEDETTYEGLRQAFMADLAPGTPYETALAHNLITLEWEAIRHRRIRDGLLLAEYRDQAMGVFSKGEVGAVSSFGRSKEDEDAAFALVNPDPEIRQPAELQLAEYQITPAEILAKAYRQVAKSVEIHERILSDIEIRRRRLRDDFDRLKTARNRPVEDAEVVEG
ncbi:MAG: hypothetical protein ACSHXD_18025 [Marinosulfonomonas sp.]